MDAGEGVSVMKLSDDFQLLMQGLAMTKEDIELLGKILA